MVLTSIIGYLSYLLILSEKIKLYVIIIKSQYIDIKHQENYFSRYIIRDVYGMECLLNRYTYSVNNDIFCNRLSDFFFFFKNSNWKITIFVRSILQYNCRLHVKNMHLNNTYYDSNKYAIELRWSGSWCYRWDQLTQTDQYCCLKGISYIFFYILSRGWPYLTG